jgi:nucleotide-binding universal stress UspA family protein
MSRSTVQLAASSAEVKASSRAAAAKSGGRIILVPVDFSDHSAAALVKAGQFAELMQATLIVLHVVHDPGEMPGYYSKLIKKKRATRIQDIAAEAFEQFVDLTAAENSTLTALQGAHKLMVQGLPVTRILEVVKYIDPMMVVMGSQGRTGLKQLVIGSKAAQIMQLCPVPVTIVKQPKTESKS